jgi:hypothetical protein
MNFENLTIYLQSHHAATMAAVEHCRRMAEENEGTEFEEGMARFVKEFERERRELRGVLDALKVEPSLLKMGTAWAGEKINRLGMIGKLSGYSALGRVMDLETLWAGVQTRIGLWRMLRLLQTDYPQLDSFDFEKLEKQSWNQLERLLELHTAAAKQVPDGQREVREVSPDRDARLM